MKPLDKPKSLYPAHQVRELGLKIGDVIQALEVMDSPAIRLELLWVGEEIAVWKMLSYRNSTGRWEYSGEKAYIHLYYNQWYLMDDECLQTFDARLKSIGDWNAN